MGKKIDVLVIDDEKYSREELIFLLQQFETIHIVGEADSGENGLKKMIEYTPDVIFVDIEMPGMNGIDLVNYARNLKKAPLVIFATAFPNFAAEAFRYDAVDYLLKPFEEEQLKEAVSRIEARLLDIGTGPAMVSGKLAVESDKDIVYLSPQQIIYISREERYTNIVTQEQIYRSNLSLKDLEHRLKDHSFCRIHKSHLVNLAFVNKLIPWFNGAYNIEVYGRKEHLSVSRNYVKELRNRLEL